MRSYDDNMADMFVGVSTTMPSPVKVVDYRLGTRKGPYLCLYVDLSVRLVTDYQSFLVDIPVYYLCNFTKYEPPNLGISKRVLAGLLRPQLERHP